MKNTPRLILFITAVFIIFLSLYGGVVLPAKKSRLILRNKYVLSKVESPDQFYDLVRQTFSTYAPPDDREAIFDYLIQLCGIMKDQDRTTTEFLVAVADENIAPLLETKRAAYFGHNVYQLGMLYELAYENTRDEVYFEKSVSYFEKALAYNENHPGSLYNLAYIYHDHGDVEKRDVYIARVMALWPQDADFKKHFNGSEGGTTE